MSHTTPSHPEAGFTVVEVLLTIVVGSVFIIALYMLHTSLTMFSANDRNQSNASDIAYSYLRKYTAADATPATWTNRFVCDTSTGSSNTNDSTVNNAAAGQILESGSVSTGLNGIPTPVTYKVTALAVYGCNGVNVKKPVRVESQITYGPNNRIIKHTSYVGYY